MEGQRDNNQKSCLGCLSLKMGSYLAAGYSLFSCIIVITVAAMALKLVPIATKAAIDSNPDDDMYDRDDLEDTVTSIVNVILYITLAIYAFWALSSLLLILGVYTKRRCLLILYIVMTCILTALEVLAAFNSLTKPDQIFTSTSQGVSFVIKIVIIILNIYAIWCVATHAKEIRKAQDRTMTVCVENMPPIGVGAPSAGPPPEYSYDQKNDIKNFKSNY